MLRFMAEEWGRWIRSCWEHIQFWGTPHFCASLEKPTSFARSTRLLANLPSSWGIEVRRGVLLLLRG